MNSILGVLANVDSMWLTQFQNEVSSIGAAYDSVYGVSAPFLQPMSIVPITGIKKLFQLEFQVFAGIFALGTIGGAVLDSMWCPGFFLEPSDKNELNT
jgi:hypothetical protein